VPKSLGGDEQNDILFTRALNCAKDQLNSGDLDEICDLQCSFLKSGDHRYLDSELTSGQPKTNRSMYHQKEFSPLNSNSILPSLYMVAAFRMVCS
jgi:hypothetical protein